MLLIPLIFCSGRLIFHLFPYLHHLCTSAMCFPKVHHITLPRDLVDHVHLPVSPCNSIGEGFFSVMSTKWSVGPHSKKTFQVVNELLKSSWSGQRCSSSSWNSSSSALVWSLLWLVVLIGMVNKSGSLWATGCIHCQDVSVPKIRWLNTSEMPALLLCIYIVSSNVQHVSVPLSRYTVHAWSMLTKHSIIFMITVMGMYMFTDGHIFQAYTKQGWTINLLLKLCFIDSVLLWVLASVPTLKTSARVYTLIFSY